MTVSWGIHLHKFNWLYNHPDYLILKHFIITKEIPYPLAISASSFPLATTNQLSVMICLCPDYSRNGISAICAFCVWLLS